MVRLGKNERAAAAAMALVEATKECKDVSRRVEPTWVAMDKAVWRTVRARPPGAVKHPSRFPQ